MCTTKVYCDDGQVLFMDVSLHSMCHSPSAGTRNRVHMSITTGVALKGKVRHYLQGHMILGQMCWFDILLHYTLSEQ